MIHLILCGGNGTRLWPLSRECKPKQFISLLDAKSLLQKTALGNLPLSSGCVVVCNNEHYHLASKQLAECHIQPIRYVLEPLPKNTAAAVCLGLNQINDEEIVLITPADHYTEYTEEYTKTIQKACQNAEDGFISIFGIAPTRPETGFGYIETYDENRVRSFHEKPDLATAKSYLRSGHFYWNSGMVCGKAGVLKKALQEYSPEIFQLSEEAYGQAEISRLSSSEIVRIPHAPMLRIPSISLDYALLEKMTTLHCVLGNFEWSDIGSFDSLYNHIPKDTDGNAVDTKKFLSIDSRNNFIMGNQRMISTIDIEDLVVVDTPDALLISRIGSTQKVREMVTQLKSQSTQLHISHPEEHRPWGSFTVLESQDTCKVKRIVVNPGKRLSLQKHRYRSEHWVVVAGEAVVTLGSTLHTLNTNQSIFIPQGELHRVENRGTSDLVIIEVQFGSYTGEDDIIRVEDDFARVPTANNSI